MTTTFKLGPQRILILNTNKEFSFFWGGGGGYTIHDLQLKIRRKRVKVIQAQESLTSILS